MAHKSTFSGKLCFCHRIYKAKRNSSISFQIIVKNKIYFCIDIVVNIIVCRFV